MESKEQALSSKLEQQRSDLQLLTAKLKERDSQLQEREREVSMFEKKAKELEQALTESRRAPTTTTTITTSLPAMSIDHLELRSIKLEWMKEKKAPFMFSRSIEAMATTDTMVYLIQGGSLYVHSITTGSWSKFFDIPVLDCSLAIIRRKLTVIGGKKADRFTSRLLSLVETAGKKEWLAIYPPMSVQRSNTITIHCQSSLIVAGGEGEDGYMKTTEVFNTDTLAWQTVADLPEPLVFASAIHTGNQLYVMGGWVEKMTPSYTVYTCSLQHLLQSPPGKGAPPLSEGEPPSAEGKSPSSEGKPPSPEGETPSPKAWSKVASLPLKGSTCTATNGRLLAVGGRDIHKPTSAVNVYNPITNSWEVLSHLSFARHQCYATVLGSKLGSKLVVMGGWRLNSKQVLAETGIIETADIS